MRPCAFLSFSNKLTLFLKIQFDLFDFWYGNLLYGNTQSVTFNGDLSWFWFFEQSDIKVSTEIACFAWLIDQMAMWDFVVHLHRILYLSDESLFEVDEYQEWRIRINGTHIEISPFEFNAFVIIWIWCDVLMSKQHQETTHFIHILAPWHPCFKWYFVGATGCVLFALCISVARKPIILQCVWTISFGFGFLLNETINTLPTTSQQ